MRSRPPYARVLATFIRNSLVRDMTFRGNFLLDTVASTSWVFMNMGFYILIFHYTPMIGADSGWGKYEFFLFYATSLLINSVVRGLFMTNATEFSEMIRTGSLDFALVKPIDTQFLVSLGRIEWAASGNFILGMLLLIYAMFRVDYVPGPLQMALYPFYLLCGIAIYYSLMFALAATAIWLGRNQTLYDFWFYVTNFSRYPMEIYQGRFGEPLRQTLTFVLPVLVAINVPARLLTRPLHPSSPGDWLLPAFTIFATLGSLAASRWVFKRALLSYRSASS